MLPCARETHSVRVLLVDVPSRAFVGSILSTPSPYRVFIHQVGVSRHPTLYCTLSGVSWPGIRKIGSCRRKHCSIRSSVGLTPLDC
jgi:hypothetical protein